MTASEVEAWREQYRATSDALEALRYQQVKALTDEDVREQIRSFQSVGDSWRYRSDWSGLVEQQAIFNRLPHAGAKVSR